MKRITWCAIAFAIATPASAQDSDVSALRKQLDDLKAQIQRIEQRLQQTEAKSGKAEESATRAEATATQAAAQAAIRPQAANALNPGTSAVLNGVYANLQRDPNKYRLNGFVPTMGDVSPGKRGLSLGESELGFIGNIDPWFRGTLIASISPDNDSIGVEEGYIQTLALPHGFSVKAGRFFSGVGYQNQIHAHAWDFADAPLAMKAFLGNRLSEDGVQLKWIAPTTLYMDVGMEVGRGRAFPGGPDGGRNKNGVSASTLFAHVGDDWGESIAWQAGLSLFDTSPQGRTYEDIDSTGTGVTNSFTGKSRLWVADAVLKWAPNGNPTYNNFKLQGEYFRRKENGALTYDTLAQSKGTQNGGFDSRQSGWYLQGVYQFIPAWRAGYRYDQLDSGVATLGLVDTGALTPADLPILGAYNPKRHTVMVDWSPSEFSRVRLQFARDYSRLGSPDNQIFLQYIVSMGAHGGHKF
jgi:hypothetical protein